MSHSTPSPVQHATFRNFDAARRFVRLLVSRPRFTWLSAAPEDVGWGVAYRTVSLPGGWPV